MSARVEIIGIPGSGKTTLVQALASESIRPIRENYRDNRYWSTPHHWPLRALSNDIAFLLQHTELVSVSPNGTDVLLCDFSFHSDLAYAQSRLEPDDLAIYLSLHSRALRSMRSAVAYIWLDVDIQQVLSNIRKRDREVERAIQLPDLSRLRNQLSKVDHVLVQSGVPILRLPAPDAIRVKEFLRQLKPAAASGMN